MNLDDAPKFQAYRQRKTSRLERFMVGCEKLITLWVACSIALFVVLVIAAQVYQTLWLPAGLSDPALVQVVGNSRALTRDGRVFEMSSNRWKPVDLPSGEAPVVWGLGREGWLVIASGEELLAFSSRYKLPKLAGPVLAVGLVHVCPTDGHSPWTDTLFAVSETQLAVEIGGEKAWMVVSLPSPASAPVVSSNCTLAWRTPAGAGPSGAGPSGAEPSGVVHIMALHIPGYNEYGGLTLDDSSDDLASEGGAVEIVSSTRTVWVLTKSGKVLEAVQVTRAGITWEALPRPPALTHPHLAAGINASMFQETLKDSDLWLSGDEAIYRYNRAKHSWQIFGPIAGKQPSSVSSLVEDEENGADITRLALVDGTVYRQQTRISGLITILILIGIPLAVVLGLLAAILLVAFLHWKRARKIPRL